MKNLRREYTSPQSEDASRVRGWILGNTKIGPVLDVKVCIHQGRYGIEVMIESLIRPASFELHPEPARGSGAHLLPKHQRTVLVVG